jgi:hypothetical protein
MSSDEHAEPAPRTCPGCGSEFVLEFDARVYCTAACRKRAKLRRVAESRPKPAPPDAWCRDCGSPIPRLPASGRPPMRCGPCRALRSLERARDRRREEHAATLALTSEPPPRRSRLLDRLTNRRSTSWSS